MVQQYAILSTCTLALIVAPAAGAAQQPTQPTQPTQPKSSATWEQISSTEDDSALAKATNSLTVVIAILGVLLTASAFIEHFGVLSGFTLTPLR